jgi:hypothetical protein
MKCIKCEHIAIKAYPGHAQVGLGRCTKERYATFYALMKDHACQMYLETEQEKIEKRIKWYENRPNR